MNELLAELGLLNVVYLVLLIIGFLYALLILLGQGLGEFHLPDIGFDFGGGDIPSFDHGEIGLPGISPMSIASFITAFGASGLIATQLFQVSEGVSLVFAVIGGLILGVVAQLIFIYIFSPQISSLRTSNDIIGATAEITIPISDGGVGQIALVSRGSRVTYGARAKSGQTFKQGELVQVVELIGSIAFVEPH